MTPEPSYRDGSPIRVGDVVTVPSGSAQWKVVAVQQENIRGAVRWLAHLQGVRPGQHMKNKRRWPHELTLLRRSRSSSNPATVGEPLD